MQFSNKEDIEAPIDYVFGVLSEFELFERSAIRRGIEVQRVDERARPGPGMAWDTVFSVRGKPRQMRIEMVVYEPPSTMRFESASKGIESRALIELLPLSPRRTRVSMELELNAKTLPARLFLQSLKLARGNLTRRFQLRMAEFAKDIETRHQRPAQA